MDNQASIRNITDKVVEELLKQVRETKSETIRMSMTNSAQNEATRSQYKQFQNFFQIIKLKIKRSVKEVVADSYEVRPAVNDENKRLKKLLTDEKAKFEALQKVAKRAQDKLLVYQDIYERHQATKIQRWVHRLQANKNSIAAKHAAVGSRHHNKSRHNKVSSSSSSDVCSDDDDYDDESRQGSEDEHDDDSRGGGDGGGGGRGGRGGHGGRGGRGGCGGRGGRGGCGGSNHHNHSDDDSSNDDSDYSSKRKKKTKKGGKSKKNKKNKKNNGDKKKKDKKKKDSAEEIHAKRQAALDEIVEKAANYWHRNNTTLAKLAGQAKEHTTILHDNELMNEAEKKNAWKVVKPRATGKRSTKLLDCYNMAVLIINYIKEHDVYHWDEENNKLATRCKWEDVVESLKEDHGDGLGRNTCSRFLQLRASIDKFQVYKLLYIGDDIVSWNQLLDLMPNKRLDKALATLKKENVTLFNEMK